MNTTMQGKTKLMNSLKSLLTLKEEEVDRFLKSYDLFHKENCSPGDEKIVRDYYNVLNYLCACGEVEKMYIPPVINMKLGIFDNQVEYEKKMMQYIEAGEGKNILDVGCGRGAVASHVASSSGANVTGINIDPTQLKLANENAVAKELTGKLTFFESSFNDPLPFEDNTFDGVYNIQAFSYAISLETLFQEIYRVMKPGTKLSVLDWVLYKYDENNQEHVDLYQKCKELIGAVHSPTVKEYTDAMEKAGFQILVNENASIDGFQYQLIDKAMGCYTLIESVIKFLVKNNILPKHLLVIFERLNKYGEAFKEGDKQGLWSSVHQFVAQKP